jgi:hypothetical protein
MKKIIFLMGAFYVVFLISCKQPMEKQKSFADIIKDDPSRAKELLDVARSLNQKKQNFSSIDPEDVIDGDGEMAVLRKKTKVKIGNDWPIIRLAAQNMLDIIGDPSQITPQDTLTFCLITYKKKSDYPNGHDHSKKRVDRYNARNAKRNPVPFDTLEGRPTFIIIPCANCISKLFPANSFFDVGRMCPPPSDGSCGYPFTLTKKSP